MLTFSVPVALVTPNQAEARLFMQSLAECNYRRVTVFTSATEAYEVASRQQFAIFLTRMEMPDMSGIVLLQKLRATGNYGSEAHLLVCNKMDAALLNIAAEYDLDYVLVPPLAKVAIVDKFQHLVKTENNLNESERLYRDAKAAFKNQLTEMADSFVRQVLAKEPKLEKALILLGDLELAGERYEQANQQYKKALAINPKSAVAVHRLAQVLMSQKDYEQASQLLNKLTLLSPHSIKVLESAGLSSFNREQYDECNAHMTKLTTLDQASKSAATLTAQVKIKTGDFTGLVDSLRRGMDEKELIQFLNNAGAKLSTENDIDGALKMYSAAADQIQHSKYLYAIHYNMGVAYRKKKETDKARIHFERSLKLNPSFAKAAAALKELTPAA